MKQLVRSIFTVGLVLAGAAVEASPFPPTNITNAPQWNSVASDIASGIAATLERASVADGSVGGDSPVLRAARKPIQLAVGKSVFEKAVLASLAESLIEKGFVVSDVVVTGGQKLDFQAIPLSKFNKPDYYLTPNNAVQVITIASLTDQGVVKARSMNGFVVDSSMLSIFRAPEQTQMKTLEVK